MKLEKQQSMFFLSDYSNGLEILIGLLGIVLVTCFCAYLLIYNILYLAVSGNVRYYGLLQTVGMTGKQLYRFMHRQMRMIAFAGIIAGLGLGSIAKIFSNSDDCENSRYSRNGSYNPVSANSIFADDCGRGIYCLYWEP